MRLLRAALPCVLLALALPAAALAQSDADSTAASGDSTAASGDSTAAPADTTQARTLISSDGAVSVYTEARPGEGIEGFWWEYDSKADLARLLDKDRRSQPLQPLHDPYGFELAIPDTITHLRDSVTVVADSILAERIDVATTFDPKYTSSYNETKDHYVLGNELTTNYPVVRSGNLQLTVSDHQEYNQSTKKVQDGRRVNTAFNYQFNPDLVSSVTVNWAKDLQERAGVTDSRSDNVTATSTLRKTTDAGLLGSLETSAGVTLGNRTYNTAVTDGQADQLQPNWRAKLSRDYEGGTASLDYSGNFSRSSRDERRSLHGVDSLGVPFDSTLADHSDERNSGNTLNASSSYEWSKGNDVKLTGSLGKDRFQYLSQVDSLAGRQETRSHDLEDLTLTVDAAPDPRIDVKSQVQYHSERTAYLLDELKTRRTTDRVANIDLTYRSWDGGRWIFKMETSTERRDYRTDQGGDVVKQKGSADFLQEITEHVDFEAAYFVTLDSYRFDQELSPSERDLRSQHGTFNVRYNPTSAITSAVRMEVRKIESVNLFPPQSGGNNTEHGFTVTPNYSWKIGGANFRGDFTADARYKVQDYAENDNTLNRRFAFRQSWQQAITSRFSTETQYRWEFNDQGSYDRDPVDGKRRFGRSRETRGRTLEFKVLYTVRKGVRTQVDYRHDLDSSYLITNGVRGAPNDLPRRQFNYSIDVTRNLASHIRLDLDFSQTLKRGKNVSDVERNYYTIKAQIVYTPFHASGRSSGS